METLKLLQIESECRGVQDLDLYCIVWGDWVWQQKSVTTQEEYH